MAGGRRGGRRLVPEVEVDEGRHQVPLSTFYSASQGQDDAEGSERRPRRARRPPPEPTDGSRGAEEDDVVRASRRRPRTTPRVRVLRGRPLGRRRSTCEAPHDSLRPRSLRTAQ
jgi:hypothetical protein